MQKKSRGLWIICTVLALSLQLLIPTSIAFAADGSYDVTAVTDVQAILNAHGVGDTVTLNFTENYTITATLEMPEGVSVIFQTKEGIAAPVTIKRGATFKDTMVDVPIVSATSTITLRNIVVDGGSPTISAEKSIITISSLNTTLRLEQGAVLQSNTVTTSSSGGAVSCVGNMVMTGNALIQNCNVAATGGGVSIISTNSLTMEGTSSIKNCTAGNDGGGVYMNGEQSLVMKDNASISGCTTGENGGGIGVSDTADATITLEGNASVLGNTATKHGSGIYLGNAADITVADNVHIGSATDTNGIYLRGDAAIGVPQNKSLGANAYINIEGAYGLNSSYRVVVNTVDPLQEGDLEKFHYLADDKYVLIPVDDNMIALMYPYAATPNDAFDLYAPKDLVFTLEAGARYEDSDHNAAYNQIVIVKEDGSFVLLKRADYTVDNTGKTPIITVKASVLSGLIPGTYALSTMHWYDGFYTHLAVGVFEVTDLTPAPTPIGPITPATGDDTNTRVWTWLALGALIVMLGVVVQKKMHA
ncbi:hypothetical protein LJC20_07105 [Eubacteriales bacterium OttesenSCG-928-M02]|nr:hypothetical protein [Eubacteriales bacterium OttesenSCG-928-M02]